MDAGTEAQFLPELIQRRHDESLRAIGMMREETASALTGKYLEATKRLMFG
ncbi:hypothetical protein HRE53_20070 [Acaryochloris sp. 'Moss Beach']|uniref:hypothetical protein n=1 Tax=Acaryochloris TaxID=155977 RepID=UPI001BAE8699|nr:MULTISPECIES: hypothetical protein [Acaryochloris]QUY43995.1 hypothetical protein I1H34_07795 [Acaryochloris marina S15]UJB68752.1 hypothetical protein HRE53_20070 [Acaryochloris sp. 'Moss Beach']